ncbi:Thiamine kinase [Evansella caseinilytica]|uniref:Thiamine kinase n=1 Tax=Evansella caseinilytica TaxID=1503961 RepID=A0A1H3RWS2_9BACI|nr:phosphotransferase family protein [Evansella caseinilytica]SDZ29309.1 Thiamine kinase [Evansella caseinilytica]
MEHFMGKEWALRPAGGVTGEAYIAEQGDQKLFIKRNSSPFLAVLSAEGIVPKLLWTKRLENGDVITAQRWINGRELKAFEMREKRVARLLAKIHRSEDLLYMFMRMGNRPLAPAHIVKMIEEKSSALCLQLPCIREVLEWLRENAPFVAAAKHVVCHADLNHNNWLVSGEENLFLIDWDGAIVADPALDIAPLLYLYVPEEEWGLWLKEYGISLTAEFRLKMKWYMAAYCLETILWHGERQEMDEVARWTDVMKGITHEDALGEGNDRL